LMPAALANRLLTTGSSSRPIFVFPAGTIVFPVDQLIEGSRNRPAQSAPQPPKAIPMLCELMYFGTAREVAEVGRGRVAVQCGLDPDLGQGPAAAPGAPWVSVGRSLRYAIPVEKANWG